MKIAPLPDNEKERIEALMRYDILDTEFEAVYDELTELAAEICGTPIALISLIDTNRQWFKSRVGIQASETPRDLAFCAHAILQDDIFMVENALEDYRFADNPLVAEDPSIRFYAGAPLITPDGYALGTLCVIDRISHGLTEKQVKALKTLANQVVSQLELRLSYDHLQNYAKQLRELNASKDKFLSIIAHDLKSPFNCLLGFTKILQSDLDSLSQSEIREIVDELHNSAEAMFKLVNNLLQWARFETGSMSWQPRGINLARLITDVTIVLKPVAAAKHISLQVEIEPDIMVFADNNMLYCIVQNLATNAIKFTPAKGFIRIMASVIDSWVEISIIDNGIGMSPQKLANLFHIETCTSTEGTAGETGTGLGLLLCQQFVEKNGGRLWIESEVGKGTKITFTLPENSV